jgi:hypothetical protein
MAKGNSIRLGEQMPWALSAFLYLVDLSDEGKGIFETITIYTKVKILDMSVKVFNSLNAILSWSIATSIWIVTGLPTRTRIDSRKGNKDGLP